MRLIFFMEIKARVGHRSGPNSRKEAGDGGPFEWLGVSEEDYDQDFKD